MSPSSLPISFASRVFSAAMSMIAPSGMAAASRPATTGTDCGGGALSNPMRSRRARRFSVSCQRSTRARVSAEASMKTSGTSAPPGTFISARTERISDTSDTTKPSSACASGAAKPAKSGQSARQSSVSPSRCAGRGAPTPALAAQSSSVR